ncbi:MAG: hypothetical protein E6K69_07000 [Nitrospirae bacterium]|nr:MAG: hypothetical protein E6K69_07000 [Nitrospirota bacterium]
MRDDEMKIAHWFGLSIGLIFLLTAAIVLAQQDPELLFAVVTKVSKDRHQVTAQVSSGGVVSEVTLIASEAVLDNPIWKKLEVCHAIKADAWKNAEGYRLVSIRALDAGMLPMALQGIAGDCMIKKALEIAPQGD